MFEKVINILIIENNEAELKNLLSILQSPQHNIFIAENSLEAIILVKNHRIPIIICDLDNPSIDGPSFINELKELEESENSNIIITSSESEKVYNVVGALKHGGVDYLLKPWIKNLVQTKIEVYKDLILKRQKVNRLLENILPKHTLHELNHNGKPSPKKHENATVLFSDFVKFTEKTKQVTPQELIERLDYYFSHFDGIMKKYHLEKIKTIGDAYMAIGGVTEGLPHPALRTAFASLEMRNFMMNDILTKKALNQDYWEIRIGIHSGSLVAGVVGTHKFSYDVWGDTVNIAARCEQNSTANQISISENFRNEIKNFFDCSTRGEIAIKNAGDLHMYYLNDLKPEFAYNKQNNLPNIELRTLMGLPSENFRGLRFFILNKMKAELNEHLIYHSYEHTLNVEKAAIGYAKLEGLSEEETILVRTAAIFHDTGFILKYNNNESIGATLLKKYAGKYGYSDEKIAIISDIILSTSYSIEPKNLMEKVMSDADHDYLGRPDYHSISVKLFQELEYFGQKMSDAEKLKMQIEYLESKHKYYTQTALNLRQAGKENRIKELKLQLKEIEVLQ